jgi:hypothetical protein
MHPSFCSPCGVSQARNHRQREFGYLNIPRCEEAKERTGSSGETPWSRIDYQIKPSDFCQLYSLSSIDWSYFFLEGFCQSFSTHTLHGISSRAGCRLSMVIAYQLMAQEIRATKAYRQQCARAAESRTGTVQCACKSSAGTTQGCQFSVACLCHCMNNRYKDASRCSSFASQS